MLPPKTRLHNYVTVALLMACLHWLPWHVNDWLTSPTRLSMSPIERSIYQDLLAFQWRDERLPSDHQTLAAMAAVPPEVFEAAAPVVLRHFNLRRGCLRNKKLAALREIAVEKATKRAQRGKKGGEAKANKFKENRASSTLQAQHARSVSISESSSGLDSKPPNQEKPSPRARVVLTGADGNGNGAARYDAGPGWERFRIEYPCIPNEDFTCQQWLSVIETAEEEAVQWTGLAAYRKSQRAKDGIWYEGHNWLRDRRYRGKYPPAIELKAQRASVSEQVAAWKAKA